MNFCNDSKTSRKDPASQIVNSPPLSTRRTKIEKDTARSVELAKQSHTAQRQEKEKNERQLRRDVLKSVSIEVRGAIDLMASNPAWDKKLEYAAAMSRKLQEEKLSIQKVVADLVAVGTDGAAEFLGVLTATLLADGKPELSNEMLIATLKGTQLPYKVANGLVGTWYQTQIRKDRNTLEITNDLCAALLPLKKTEVYWRQWADLYIGCQQAMKQCAFGFIKQAYDFIPRDWEVLGTINSLK
jgi:hypothetical protein